ncbi:flagellar basal body rod protein FlgF [Jeongeupia chitinilytica]|uniref:Flagellar basal-body rod protein FlgF n=1 Tax=Jeongeupia chitinilytica TaxID=1041641 RepID=A0ABQ3H1W6_9NEIS|nr:flagellar basal body rod protein FlgF [Jeongeupia chitinilytica]GHD63416.1 flagellar basal body protein [Jeongeupia chitinilytica]
MDALIYTVMSGADRTLRAQQVHANNIANLETAGFRADMQRSVSQQVQGFGYEARHATALQANTIDQKAGVLTATGRDLDVAVKGLGFLTVGLNGGEAYTREGSLEVDDRGALTVKGRPVLGDGGAIVLPPFEAIQIGEDGTISIRPEGETAMQQVDRLKLVKPAAADISKNVAGLIVPRSGVPLPADDTVTVVGGQLERSNVSAIDEMVSTMGLNRDFEVQMRLYKAADEMADAGNRLIRQ